jgi:hypothetical protein
MNHPEELPPRLHWFHHPKREGLERLHEINPATWSLISPFNHHHCHTTTVISRALLSAAAGVAIIGGSIYYSFTSWTAAGENGRREVMSQLTRFGPNRVRWMCLNIGIRFIKPENGDANADRALEDELTAGIRAALEAELRESMKGKSRVRCGPC